MQILFYSRIWLLLNIKFASSYKFLCFLSLPPLPTTFLSILDSDQPQGEMLLKSGSRLPKNDRLTQSTGELDVTSTYLAKGPQRDCSTLPSYHRPPSYEEASKQKDRIMNQGRVHPQAAGRSDGKVPRKTGFCITTYYIHVLSISISIQLSLLRPLNSFASQ